MKNHVKTALLLSTFSAVAVLTGCQSEAMPQPKSAPEAAETVIAPRCEFDSPEVMKKEWRISGAFGTLRKTKFTIVDEPTAGDKKVLAVVAKKSSGFLVLRIKGQDLNKYPRMRWRWRVIRNLNLPVSKDKDPDDQPCVIYVSTRIDGNDKSVAYRWECNTEAGLAQKIEYPLSKTVYAYCLRNRGTAVGEWVEEERNVLEDFKAAFGMVPSDFVIIIGGNSQHSSSNTRAEIDYIEFLPAAKSDK